MRKGKRAAILVCVYKVRTRREGAAAMTPDTDAGDASSTPLEKRSHLVPLQTDHKKCDRRDDSTICTAPVRASVSVHNKKELQKANQNSFCHLPN
jgi:hypothetical protein